MATGGKCTTAADDLFEGTSVNGERAVKKRGSSNNGQYIAALIATASLIVSAQNCSWPTGALPKIIEGSAGYNLTNTQKSLLAGLPDLGAVFSPIPCSYAMDRFGRKAILSASIFFAIVAWAVLSFSTSPYLILLSRLVMGLWNGTEYITVSIYVAEVVDPNVRGSLISLTGVMFFAGTLYVSLISFFAYRTMTLLCLIAPTLTFIGFLFIPESPYYYLMHGKRKEAEEAICWLRGECKASDLDIVEKAVKEQLLRQGSFKEIFTKSSNRKGFFLVECFKACSSSGVTPLLYAYSTLILPYGWLSPQQSHIVICLAWVVSAVISSTMMYNFKRRSIMVISTIGAMIFAASGACWYYLRDFTSYDTSTTNWLPLLIVIGALFFETYGIFNIPNVIKGEIFPINIKTKACALTCMTACGLESFNLSIFFFVNSRIGIFFHFAKAACSALFALFIVIFFMIETKDHTLEKIQEMLNSKKASKGCHSEAAELEALNEKGNRATNCDD